MTWFFGNRKSLIFALTLAFILAAAIRSYDLTDPPLDFAPARQLFSALKARGMYYAMLPANSGSTVDQWQRELAISQWKSLPAIEPPILEAITALTYRVAGEHIWIARLYSDLFWVLAGLPLFLLSLEISGASGALMALLFYLFLPFGILSSRAFQPDPLMVALVICGAWASFRWAEGRNWKWAIAAGIFNGLAILVKNAAFFPLVFGLAALAVEFGTVKSLKDKQTWAVLVLSLLPAAIYTIYGFVNGFMAQQFAFSIFPRIWIQPDFYLRWIGQLEGLFGVGALALALPGIFLAKRRGMAILTGLFLGYIVFGMTFADRLDSHDFYQMLLIPILAIAIAPVAEALFGTIARLRIGSDLGQKMGWNGVSVRAALVVLILFVVALQVQDVHDELSRKDWRLEVDFWAGLGEKLGHSSPVLAITPDYGYRLAYWGWQEVIPWYDTGDSDLRFPDNPKTNLLQRFQGQSAGKHFLVVTQPGILDHQPGIKDYVDKTYPIFAQGQDYAIFDLTKTK